MSELTRELAELAGQWIVRETVFVVPAAPSVLTPVTVQDPTRWALIFACANAVGQAAILTTLADAQQNATFGLQVQGGDNVKLGYREFGGLVQAQWFIVPQTQPTNLNVFEVLLQQ